MKTWLPLACMLCSQLSFTQTTLTLQPGPEGKDAKIFNIGASANYGNDPEFIASTLFYSNEPGTQRSLIAFDLSSIPTTAGIVDARLSLFHNPEAGSEGHVGNNASYLRRIIQPWNEATVNFINAPAYTEVNQVTIPASGSATQDYLDIDVSQLVRDMITNPSQSHGFMFMGVEEAVTSSMKFYSSDASIPSKRPLLVVTWVPEAVNCVTLQPGNEGKDAKVFSQESESNFGGTPDLIAAAWNFNGSDEVLRSYIEFDLDDLPNNIQIVSADLSLFYDNDSPDGHAGDNSIVLQRITEAWTENSVSWGDQPATSTNNQVVLPASASSDQDYQSIDITGLVSDIVNNPNSSHGIAIRLQTEQSFRRVVFASGDHDDEARRPKLEVCFSFGTPTKDIDILPLVAHPNPFDNELILDGLHGNVEITICDLRGRLCYAKTVIAENQPVRLAVDHLQPGMYVVSATDENARYISRVVKPE